MKRRIRCTFRNRCGFTLVEVVVALAMLALIAGPAVGLAALAAKRTNHIAESGSAAELGRRIDAAFRSYYDPDAIVGERKVFEWDLPVTFQASRDLRYIDIEDVYQPTDFEAFYQVVVSEPQGFTYIGTESFRFVVIKISWQNQAGNREGQLHFSSVIRRM